MKHHYRQWLERILILSCLAGNPLMTTVYGEEPTTLSRQQFQEIASRLDLGGDLLLVANTDTIIDQTIAAAMADGDEMPTEDPNEREIRETIERFRAFVHRNGFSSLHGIGLSLMPCKDGQHTSKLFISRDFTASGLPLWRGLVGWQPRRLLSLDFMPANTAMVRAGTPELTALWQVVRSAIDEVATEPLRTHFETWHNVINDTLGLPLEDVLSSLRDEVLVAVELSETTESIIPTKNGLISIPTPSFLIIVGINNDILRGIFEAKVAKHNISLAESQVGDVIMRSTVSSVPFPIPLQPAYASEAGFFILGSSPDIVANALLAYRHKNGLISRPEFRNAFQGLSMVNNGIVYMSPIMGKVLKQVHEAKIRKALAGAEKHPATTRMLNTLMAPGGKNPSCALTIQNWKTGIMVMGNTAWGGKDVITQMASIPARLLMSLFEEYPLSSSIPSSTPETTSEESSNTEGPPTE